jgi:hypothetical protein
VGLIEPHYQVIHAAQPVSGGVEQRTAGHR